MKKTIFLSFALMICLALCSCAQQCSCTCGCNECVCSKANTAKTPAEQATESNDNMISFETPVVIAEDEFLRIELVKFYQEYRRIALNGYAEKVAAGTEGATLEKFVVFRFYNKSDHELSIFLSDFYLGNDGATPRYTDRSSQEPAPGKNVVGEFMIQTGEKETLESMDELYSINGAFSVSHQYGDGVLRDQYKLNFDITDALDGNGGAENTASDHSKLFMQFREYLQMRGPVTVVTEEIKNDKSTGKHQVTIEATEHAIQLLYEDEVTSLVGKASAAGNSVFSFVLMPNAKTVNAQVEYFLGSSDGEGHENIQSCITTYELNIQNYRRGDDLSLTADYTQVDENGNSIKKEGTVLTLKLTNPCNDIVTVLSQVLTESGLDMTMADLGFTNF